MSPQQAADESKSVERLSQESVALPRPTLERLPAYYRVVAAVVKSGEAYVASSELGRRLQIDDAQVRRDLSCVWGKGRPGLGYKAADLLQRLEDVLGFNNITDAVLVGAGKLGLALCGYSGFRAYGIEIVAVFDADEAKVGQPLPGARSGGQAILPVDKLGDLVQRLRIQLGIITVPDAEAQAVADTMVEAGIMAIWNFAPVSLVVPSEIVVRNEDLAAGLATLQHYLTR
ncbi:MAG: redox-sensing transcriptional repressor Rex [Limnochordia bacterium]